MYLLYLKRTVVEKSHNLNIPTPFILSSIHTGLVFLSLSRFLMYSIRTSLFHSNQCSVPHNLLLKKHCVSLAQPFCNYLIRAPLQLFPFIPRRSFSSVHFYLLHLGTSTLFSNGMRLSSNVNPPGLGAVLPLPEQAQGM